MKRRDFLKTSAGVIFSLSPFISSCGNFKKKKENPNILYISMEDLSPLLGCYGNEVVITPHIDEFATESVLLSDCHCQVALCTPSRTSILTGIRPSTSGIVKIDDDWKHMLPDAVSMPRHFRDNGYMTYRVGKISDPRCGGSDEAWSISKEEWGVTDNVLSLQALKMVTSQEKPFFLAIGYKQVHEPWHPSPQSLDMYNLDDIELVGRGKTYKGNTLEDKELRELVRAYYASITDVDRLIGEILEVARELGLYENTIILVGAMDHGYSLGEHGRWGKGNNYDTETHVPLLIRLPENQNNGRVANGITELVDIYPTLIDLCGLARPPQELEGISMRKLLENPDRIWKKAAFTHRAYGIHDRGLKTSKYTLISNENGKIELYDRINDPGNTYDISDENPEIVGELSEILKMGWRKAKPEKI